VVTSVQVGEVGIEHNTCSHVISAIATTVAFLSAPARVVEGEAEDKMAVVVAVEEARGRDTMMP
jgi:hypothetical protein